MLHVHDRGMVLGRTQKTVHLAHVVLHGRTSQQKRPVAAQVAECGADDRPAILQRVRLVSHHRGVVELRDVVGVAFQRIVRRDENVKLRDATVEVRFVLHRNVAHLSKVCNIFRRLALGQVDVLRRLQALLREAEFVAPAYFTACG